ncbi:MAG: glycosyltransferase family 4 protein [Elusimicrobia bacterium]|nr:glycosyltransferase family 4 protein [Elusimicrobiota bacterium]
MESPKQVIKAAHIITRLDFGGAQGNTLYTVSALDRRRFDAVIVTGPGGLLDGKAEPGRLIAAGSLVRELNPLKDLAALFQLRAILKGLSPDVAHTHSSKAGILGRLAAAAAGVPAIVHTFHGFGFHPRQNLLKRSLFVLLEKFCARFTDVLVFVSKSNMETARAAGIGSPEQYRLIRSGVKLSGYPAPVDRAAKRAELGLSPADTVVLSIGNAKPQKNPGHFLEAAARLSARHPAARFVFAGGGEELGNLRAAARARGLERTCLFTGWREDSAELLAASDIFVLTSLWEGLPRSLVEAFKTGLPAVCYRTDGVADILKAGVNGFSPEPGDLDAFCSALSGLLGDPALRARLAAGAAATDLREFDIDFMVRQQEALYEELLQRKGLKK